MLLKSFVNLTVIIVLLLSACKKSKSPELLPTITQEGKNTFGCIVNGKVYTPKDRFNSYLRLSARYSNNGSAIFNIIAPKNLDGGDEVISFNNIGLEIFEGQTYKFGDRDATNVILANYSKFVNLNLISYDSKTDLPGNITITKLTSNIISGTFSFDAINSDGEKVEVREGRFDSPKN